MADALLHMGLDFSVWDGVRQVANAGSMASQQGKHMHPRLLNHMVNAGALPADFQCSKGLIFNAVMVCALDWLDNAM